MKTGQVKPEKVDTAFLYPFLLARTEELEGLYSKLQVTLEESSQDSKELRESNASKDEILGLMAHELRGPLTTIIGNASFLLTKRDRLTPAVVDAALEDIQADGRRLERIIANLLVLARPDLAKPSPDAELDYYRFVRTTIENHRRAWPKREIRLVADEMDMLVTAHQDYTEEVLVNLLSNAEKYSAADQLIEVTLHTEGDCIVTSVLDRGDGISQEEAELIFEPFYRSPATATKAFGVGLGLAACKRLVTIQGGRLWVTPRDGGGSKFSFTLPASRSADGV